MALASCALTIPGHMVGLGCLFRLGKMGKMGNFLQKFFPGNFTRLESLPIGLGLGGNDLRLAGRFLIPPGIPPTLISNVELLPATSCLWWISGK